MTAADVTTAREAMLAGVRADAEEVTRLEAELAAARDRRDVRLRQARAARVTFNELGAASGLTRSRLNQIV